MLDVLIKAIGLAKTQTALADRVNAHIPEGLTPIGQWTVNFWLKRNEGKVNPDYVIPMCKGLDFQITPHEFRPDIYPHPHDGLPEHLREVA